MYTDGPTLSLHDALPISSRLNEMQKRRVFNDQELINNILTSADEDSRLVCRREKKTGTHMASNQCMTVAARQRAADHARDTLFRTPPHALHNRPRSTRIPGQRSQPAVRAAVHFRHRRPSHCGVLFSAQLSGPVTQPGAR